MVPSRCTLLWTVRHYPLRGGLLPAEPLSVQLSPADARAGGAGLALAIAASWISTKRAGTKPAVSSMWQKRREPEYHKKNRCGSGGTGRRARLRILWGNTRGGSTPLSRTTLWSVADYSDAFGASERYPTRVACHSEPAAAGEESAVSRPQAKADPSLRSG